MREEKNPNIVRNGSLSRYLIKKHQTIKFILYKALRNVRLYVLDGKFSERRRKQLKVKFHTFIISLMFFSQCRNCDTFLNIFLSLTIERN